MHQTPRQFEVAFPYVSDDRAGIGKVRVIDWGRPVCGGQITKAGPRVYELGKTAEVERIARTERAYGAAPAARARADPELVVDFVLPPGTHLTGESYGLALAIADRMARGSWRDAMQGGVFASGILERDGSVRAVGALTAKLHAVAAQAKGAGMESLTVIVPAENFDLPDDALGEAVALLKTLGARVLLARHLAAPVGEGPASARPAPLDKPRLWRREHKAWLILLAVAAGIAVSIRALTLPTDCQRLADPHARLRCLGAVPPQVELQCRTHINGGYTLWRACSSQSCLGPMDKFRLRISSDRGGWLYAWHLDESTWALTDLGPGAGAMPIRQGEPVLLPKPGLSFQWHGDNPEERFYALVTQAPGNWPLSLTEADTADAIGLRAALTQVAAQVRICHDTSIP